MVQVVIGCQNISIHGASLRPLITMLARIGILFRCSSRINETQLLDMKMLSPDITLQLIGTSTNGAVL